MSALTLAQPLHHPLARHPAALAEADTPEGADAPDSRSCGWFESSWDLQQGLAVSELPDSDSAVAALWFSQPGSRSARLQ